MSDYDPFQQWLGEQSLTPDQLAILNRMRHYTYPEVMDLTGPGPATMQRWLTRFSLDEILAGVDESFLIHRKWDPGEDNPSIPSIRKAFHKVPSMAQRLIDERTRPWIGRCLYIQGIFRNRLSDKTIKVLDLIEGAHLNGVSLDEIQDFAKQVDTHFEMSTVLDMWQVAQEAA